MKIYLDDVRPCPNGWTLVRWPEEAIELLKNNPGKVEALSLDHDLACAQTPERTGYDVLVWLEEQVIANKFMPPHYIRVHSDNASAAAKMRAAIRNIVKHTPCKHCEEPFYKCGCSDEVKYSCANCGFALGECQCSR